MLGNGHLVNSFVVARDDQGDHLVNMVCYRHQDRRNVRAFSVVVPNRNTATELAAKQVAVLLDQVLHPSGDYRLAGDGLDVTVHLVNPEREDLAGLLEQDFRSRPNFACASIFVANKGPGEHLARSYQAKMPLGAH